MHGMRALRRDLPDRSHLAQGDQGRGVRAGVAKMLAEMNSRMTWSGRVHNQIIGESDPVFQTFALLEYASQKNYFN